MNPSRSARDSRSCRRERGPEGWIMSGPRRTAMAVLALLAAGALPACARPGAGAATGVPAPPACTASMSPAPPYEPTPGDTNPQNPPYLRADTWPVRTRLPGTIVARDGRGLVVGTPDG